MSKHHRDRGETYLKSLGGQKSSNGNCQVNYVTELQRIQQTALESVNVGQRLNISLLGGRQIAVMNGSNQTCGYLTDLESQNIVSCLTDGHEYVAIVLDKQTNYCQLRVQNK